jgi:transposase
MPKKYAVELTANERQELETIISRGKSSARQIRRAHILLMSADGKTDAAISELLRVSQWTVYSTRKCWTEERLSRGLADKARAGRPLKLDGKQEAYLVALACTDAPEGRDRWTLQLLADRLVQLHVVEEPVSYETVRDRLKKRTQALAQGTMVYSRRWRRFRVAYGRCPGLICGAVQAVVTGGVFR